MYLPSRPAIRPWLKDPPKRVEQKPQEPPNVEDKRLKIKTDSYELKRTELVLTMSVTQIYLERHNTSNIYN